MRPLLLALLLTPAVAAAQDAVIAGAATSARQAATSQAGSFLPTDDPYAFHLNPALLPGARDGLTLGAASVPLGFIPTEPGQNLALAGGRDVRLAGVPLRVGAGLSHVRLSRSFPSLGSQGQELGDFLLAERATSLGVGMETRGPVRLALGASGRLFGGTYGLEGARNTTTALSADLGALATADLAALAGATRGAVRPVAQLSVGYAQRNIGPVVDYEYRIEDEAVQFREALPRQAALGWSATLGTDVEAPGGVVPAVRVRADLEGVGSLVEGGHYGPDPEYAPLFGALRVGHAFTGRAREQITGCEGDCSASYQYASGHRAVTLEVGGMASVSLGSRDFGGSLDRQRSWGLGFDVGGALRTLGAMQDDAGLRSLGERFGLRLDYGRFLAREDGFFPTAEEGETTNAFTLTLGWRP